MTTSISIYGVGRSGTKLTQLVTCMALARQYHTCDLSYEPFYWANRHCTQVSLPGIREHGRLPLFLTEAAAQTLDSPYLRAKTRRRNGVPLVNKFIRGNGRIRLIDRLATPDLSVFVFRPVVSVLDSLRRCQFDLLGEGQQYPSDQPRLVEEIRCNPELTVSASFLERCVSTEDLNALWWLSMNEAALTAFAEIHAAGRPVILIDQRWFAAHPLDGAQRLLTSAGVTAIDIPVGFLHDAWMRQETVLQTVAGATSPLEYVETDELPFRDRIFCRLADGEMVQRTFVPREPDPALAMHPLYREIDEAFVRMLNRFDPAVVCAAGMPSTSSSGQPCDPESAT